MEIGILGNNSKNSNNLTSIGVKQITLERFMSLKPSNITQDDFTVKLLDIYEFVVNNKGKLIRINPKLDQIIISVKK